jgi:hypothetical protein
MARSLTQALHQVAERGVIDEMTTMMTTTTMMMMMITVIGGVPAADSRAGLDRLCDGPCRFGKSAGCRNSVQR